MKIIQKMRRGAATAAVTSILLASSAAVAHEGDDHGCAQYARVSCQNDGDYSYQCFEARYYECLDFFHGGGGFRMADYVRNADASA